MMLAADSVHRTRLCDRHVTTLGQALACAGFLICVNCIVPAFVHVSAHVCDYSTDAGPNTDTGS